MSLINQVLTDLDARRAGGGEAARLPAGVRPVSAVALRPPKPVWMQIAGGLLVGALVLAGGSWWWLRAQSAPAASVRPDLVAAATRPIGGGIPPAPERSVDHSAADSVANLATNVATNAATDSAPIAAPPSPAPAGAAGEGIADAVVTPSAVLSERPPTASEPTLRMADRLARQRTTGSVPASGTPNSPRAVATAVESAATSAGAGATSPRQRVEQSTDAGPRVDKTARPVDPTMRAQERYRQALRDASLGREQAALAGMEEALVLDPRSVEIRQAMLRLLVERGEHGQAEAVLAEGLARVPEQREWAMLLSRLRLDRGDAAAAQATLVEALARHPDDPDLLAALGAIQHSRQRYGEAEQSYRRAAERQPDIGRHWLGLALAQEAAGQSDEARAAYAKALQTGSLNEELAAYAKSRMR